MNSNIKVMILDDNKEFVKLLETYVNTQDDMEVIVTDYDGKNAVELVKTFKPDVLLIDIIMPEKDGLVVLEELSKNSDVKVPLIIVMSAIGQEKITQKAITLGATYYVVKPFDMATLVERLRELIDNNSSENSGKYYNSAALSSVKNQNH